jgi:PhnB protein
MLIQPYLCFDGSCEQALEFYKKALGAKVDMMMRFKENPDPQPGMCPPGSDDKILHVSFRIGDNVIMASDGYGKGNPEFKGFALSITAANVAEADRIFNALADGGKVDLPQSKTFYSPRFGMVTDRFGMHWMVIVQP